MTYTADWFSNNIENWKKDLAKYKGVSGLNVLEIGCFEGKATVWLGNFIGDSFHYTVVDTFEGSIEHKDLNFSFSGVYSRFRENIKEIEHKGQINTYADISINYLSHRRESAANSFDIIYIDGSHMAADVLTDAVLAFPMLKKGGVMIFDDYEWLAYPEPYKTPKVAIDSFLACFETEYRLVRKEYQVVIEKI